MDTVYSTYYVRPFLSQMTAIQLNMEVYRINTCFPEFLISGVIVFPYVTDCCIYSPKWWGDQGGYCEGAADQLITWGCPIATFRWDNATDVDFKNFSVREIELPPPSYG